MKWSFFKLLLNLLLIPTFVVISMKVTAPDAITKNIIEEAPNFYVLGLNGSNLRMLTLKNALASEDEYVFWLNQESVELNVGDMHRIKIVETTSDEQVIEFYYQNSYSSTSRYSVSSNKITPLKYKVNHHFGQGPIFLLALILAVISSSLIVWLFRRKIKVRSY